MMWCAVAEVAGDCRLLVGPNPCLDSRCRPAGGIATVCGGEKTSRDFRALRSLDFYAVAFDCCDRCLCGFDKLKQWRLQGLLQKA